MNLCSLRFVCTIAASVALTSCAYYFDESVQFITVETPGAENAYCHVYIDDVKYKVKPPEKISVKKDREPMLLDCFAPGNRHVQKEVESKVEETTYLNVLNGAVPGGSWDFMSDSMFVYPDHIFVDFSNEKVVRNKLPAHNSPDIVQPEEYELEEFLPSVPRLNRDKYDTPVEILSRQQYEDGFETDDSLTNNTSESPALGKGDLAPTKGDLVAPSDPLDPSLNNETTSESLESTNAPTKLFPLE